LQAIVLEPQQRRCQQDLDEVLRSIREKALVYSAQQALDIHSFLVKMAIKVDATIYELLTRRSPFTNAARGANAILAIIPGKGMVPGLVHDTRVHEKTRGASPERVICAFSFHSNFATLVHSRQTKLAIEKFANLAGLGLHIPLT